MLLNQSSNTLLHDLLDRLFNSTCLVIYRYFYTFLIVIVKPQKVYENGIRFGKCLSPSLFWIINVIALEMFFYNVGVNEILGAIWGHNIENHLYWPMYEIISLFFGNVIFALILSTCLSKGNEEYFLRIFNCGEYASVLFLPYAVLTEIIKSLFNSTNLSGLLVLRIFLSVSEKSLLSTEEKELSQILLNLPKEESLIPLAIGMALSFGLWLLGVYLWSRIIYRALQLKHCLKKVFIVVLVMICITLLPFGYFLKLDLNKPFQTMGTLSDAIDIVKMEEKKDNRNYMMLSYLCRYISQSIGDDEANQFKYEVLSILYKQAFICQELGLTDKDFNFSFINTNINSVETCRSQLKLANEIHKMCMSYVIILGQDTAFDRKTNIMLEKFDNSKQQVALDNPLPEKDYSYYSSELIGLKKRLNDADKMAKKLSHSEDDYIYPDPRNQTYETPIYARLDIKLFPFYSCF